MDRLHRVVLQVGVKIWPTWKAAKAQPGAKTPAPASAQWARQMRDFEETMKPAYDLLLPDASVIHELERTNHIMTSELWLLNRMLYKNKNQVNPASPVCSRFNLDLISSSTHGLWTLAARTRALLAPSRAREEGDD